MISAVFQSRVRLLGCVRRHRATSFAMTPTPHPRPIVVSGPSGGGKSTILQRAMKEYPTAFAFSVSHTTRQPRAGENHGVDYFYVTRNDMQQMIDNGEFFEHAEFGGNMYGTSKKAVESIQSTGRICVLDVEIQGVRNIKKSHLNARYFFLQPPSIEILEKRLRDRQTETEETLKKRLDHAKQDLEAVSREPTLFDYTIVNDKLDDAYAAFMNVIADDLKMFKKQG